MATFTFKGFTATTGIDFGLLTSESLQTILDYDTEKFTSTGILFKDDAKNYMQFTGTGLEYKYQGGEVYGITAGKFTGFKVVSDGITIASASGLSVTGKLVSDAIDSGKTSKFFDALLSGSDKITATKYADNIVGGAGNDKIYGLGGADTMHGNAGNDQLYGDAGNDKLYGDAGNDKLYGGNGNDQLYGGAGKDLLDGGAGKDMLTGGGGVDTFVFRKGYGVDTITDFNAVGKSHDILDLTGVSAITSFKDLKENHLSVSGDKVIIDATGGDKIILEGVKLADLDKGDFLF